jgi:predicted nucleic acid-binding protein
MANALVMAERRGKLLADDVEKSCQLLEAMLASGIEVRSEWRALREAIHSTRKHQLTAYDAEYLELARRERLPLATLDKSLRSAARTAGIEFIV